LIAGFAAAAVVTAQEPPRPLTDVDITTAPVQLDGATLFRVRGVSSLPAEARARVIQEALEAVAADRTISVDSIRAVEGDAFTRILANDTVITTVVDADATLEQVRRSSLAASHLLRIQRAIRDYRDARTPSARRRGVLNALVATLILMGSSVVLILFWRRIDRVFTRRLQTQIHSVGIQSFELVRAESIAGILQTALIALRTVVFLVMALAYLDFVIAQFPRTRGLSQDLVSFALAPLQVMGLGLVAHVPSLVFLTVLYFVVRLGLRLVRLLFHAVQRGAVTLAGFDPAWADSTYKLIRVAVITFAIIVAFPYIPGSSTAAFQGVSIFVGVLFSLGSSSAISNTIAGYMLTYRRALKVGDRVKIGNAVGDVIEVRLQVTHLRSVKNEEIIIPNSQILASEVLNYSSLTRTDGLILHTEIGVGYDTSWRKVEAMLLAAADRTEGLSKKPSPFVLEKELGVFAVTYELNAYCNNAQAMLPLYAELHRNVLDEFNRHGVQIMVPAYEGDPKERKVVAREDSYPGPQPGIQRA
jgi:small-conductance mechanosensitive channel